MTKLLQQVFILAAILLSIQTYSQNFVGYTQFSHNDVLINPSYAASKDYFTLSGNVRKQWVGIEGAPTTYTVSAFGLLPNNTVGIGLNVVNDKVGATTQQLYNLVYSYRLNLKKSVLSFGINTGIKDFKTNISDLLNDNYSDPYFNIPNSHFFMPFVGIGAYFKKDNYSIGLSIPYFMNNPINNQDYDLPVEEQLYIYLSGNLITKFNNGITLKNKFLIKTVMNSTVEVDFSSSVFLNDHFNVGLTYKSNSTIALELEYSFNQQYYVSYSYDFATTDMIKAQLGSHEITLTRLFGNIKQHKYSNPRYF